MAQQNQIGKTHTTVKSNNGYTFVTYHSTDVVAFNDHSVVLNSGGYRTATTKTRMNQASSQFNLGFNVYQEKGKWYVWLKRGGRTVDFEDGMTFAR